VVLGLAAALTWILG